MAFFIPPDQKPLGRIGDYVYYENGVITRRDSGPVSRFDPIVLKIIKILDKKDIPFRIHAKKNRKKV